MALCSAACFDSQQSSRAFHTEPSKHTRCIIIERFLTNFLVKTLYTFRYFVARVVFFYSSFFLLCPDKNFLLKRRSLVSMSDTFRAML